MAPHFFFRNVLAAFAASAALANGALPAAAQPAPAGPPPSYAVPGDEHIHGRITTFDGKYGVAVRDDRGFVDNVRLHDGTIINPRGLRLASGEEVTIYGRPAGASFAANEIDTPYRTLLVTGYPYGYPFGWGPGYRFGFGYGPYGYGHVGFGFGGRW